MKFLTSIPWSIGLICFVVFATSLRAQQPSFLQSDGKIYNSGTIKILGDAAIAQDTIGGVVRYERNDADSQLVAHVTYADLHFEGASVKKMLDNTRPVEADSLFWSVGSDVVFDLVPDSYIRANRTVIHQGEINPGLRYGRFVLQGTENQDVSGSGLIPILELNNDQGATITQGGGLRVYERLDLQIGLLSNAQSDNINMQREAWIWRDDSGFIAEEPGWNTRVHLRYYGVAPMLGGPEMVRNTTAIGNLVQDDTQGLTLPYDITVNDSLILRGHIFTEEDDANRHELNYANTIDPLFDGWWPEVIGTMVRTSLVDGQTQVMNNARSSILFASAADRGAVVQYAVRSQPRTVPLPTTDITFKVDRFLQLEARNNVGDKVVDSTYTLTYGYAWRNREIDGIETPLVVETIPQLRASVDQLVLMRYDGIAYNPYGFSQLPTTAQVNPAEAWRYSTAQFVRASGDFAIGLSTGPIWVLNTRVFLEGPMLTYGENFIPEMTTDLALAGVIPMTAPDIYPYNLDIDRTLKPAVAIGDTIVDWVTVEFRTSPTASGEADLVETLLLAKDGQMLDPQTLRPRIISGIPAGLYNVAVKHRNHLAVISEDKVLVDRSNIGFVLDFTSGVGVFGGANAQKLIGTNAGRRWFGLIAGEVNAGDEINRTDYNLVWNNRNVEAYSLFDTDLNGNVTTRDLNVTWNNRERISVAPR